MSLSQFGLVSSVIKPMEGGGRDKKRNWDINFMTMRSQNKNGMRHNKTHFMCMVDACKDEFDVWWPKSIFI